MPRARGVLADRTDLAAAAQLLHKFCFDRIELETPKLRYEPRWSCQCTKDCAAVWVASKSGDVMRIDLCPPKAGPPEQRWFPGNREARTLYHQHDGAALGGGSFLFIGRDDGSLDIVADQGAGWIDRPPSQHRHGSRGSFHLDSWWERRDQGHPDVSGTVERTQRARDKYAAGVTAIAVLSQPGSPDTIHILVTTRYPWLYVIEATRSKLRLQQRIAMPGWIEWIIGPQNDDEHVVFISRGGEIVRFLPDDLLRGRGGKTTELSLLPTAAMPLGGGSLLLGTTIGPFLLRHGCAEGIALPVTRSPVLCLDRVELQIDGEPHEYITMGLEDRRMRVVDAQLLRALAHGDRRPTTHNRSFAIDMSDAVLAVEALRLDAGPPDVAYVLAVLRDHSVCLFHVTSPQAQRRQVLKQWREHVHGPSSADDAAGLLSTRLAAELEAARAKPPTGCDPNAWKYMLIDVVLPRLREQVSADGERRGELVRLARDMAAGADRFVLHRLSLELGQLADHDVGLLLDLSRAILAAVPHGNDRRWAAFIDSHLRDLNALVRRCHGHDRARLVAWTRFVRKYVLLGNTFAAKQFGLLELVEQNHEIRKHLDALIYQTRLVQRCYDLRWEGRVDDEVAELHTVDCGAGRTIVVVVTIDGTLVFLDGISGRRLKICDRSRIRRDGGRDVLTPFGSRGPARTLACAVERHPDRFRVVMSCSGTRVPSPGLMVIEARWATDDTGTVIIIDSVLEAACDDPHVRVYALQPLPGAAAFVAGLETRGSPVGRLQRLGETWKLELATDASPTDGPDARPVERPSLAPGKMPTRALGVVAIDGEPSRYLVVAGSDDGLVRAISFAASDSVSDWQVCRWDRMVDAVSSIVLGRVRSLAERGVDPDNSLFSCYLGTAAGDTVGLAIMARKGPGAGATTAPFGDYDAQPLWRETHDGGILAMRLWCTPLYPADEPNARTPSTSVLVAVTEKGRLCFYRHFPCPEKERVSATFNYYFRGMRFDRVTMPDRLCALTMIDGSCDFVAAGPGGRLYMARLVYLRDSADRSDHEPRRAWEPSDVLPREMWARMHHLLAASRHDDPFEVEEPRREGVKLDLCDLVRLEGGALASYVLRERLVFQEPWQRLGAEGLRDKARRLLDPLEPENPEDVFRIKVIIKSLCRAHLYVDPGNLRKQILAAPSAVPARRPETATTCEVVAEYLTRDLAYSTRAAARLRIVAIKELLRVPVLWHMAQPGEYGSRIRGAVESALDSCLRDDDHLVRIEALRALCVALRNVGIMADPDPVAEHDRARFIQALFPRGLDSVAWLLALIVGGLQRFPSFTRRAALVSGAWHHIKALLPLFRIFPDHTLALCDYLVRAGLSVEVVAMCCQLLRPRRAAAIRIRIENLYLLPVLASRDARHEYIERHDRSKPGHQKLLEEMPLGPRLALEAGHPALNTAPQWYELDDAVMADRLLQLLDQLARMWSVKEYKQIGEVAKSRPATAVRDAPLGALESVVLELASIAEGLAKPDTERDALKRLMNLGDRHGLSVGGGSALTVPLRTIVSGVVAAWRDVFDPPYPQKGDQIGKYKLGDPFGHGGVGLLFRMDQPPELATKAVIKVLTRPNMPGARKRFLDSAWFNKELCENSEHKDYIVEVIDIVGEPRPAYVMPKYHKALKEYLEKRIEEDRKLSWAEDVADHVGRALEATHARDRWHGDVKPANILVSKQGDDRVFHLGDFGLADISDDTPETSISIGTAGIVPECLKRKSRGHNHIVRRQWEDIAALSLILYRVLTGQVVDGNTSNLRDHVKTLREIADKDPRVKGRCAWGVIQTLIGIFEKPASFDIKEFMRRIAETGPGQAEPNAPMRAKLNPSARILFLSASPPDKPELKQTREFELIRERLQRTRYRDDYLLEAHWLVKVDQLQTLILEHAPAIVHFSGHGTTVGELVFDGPGGNGAPLAAATFARIFEILRSDVRCVVLSACYSHSQAIEIVKHIDVVIGMRDAIQDTDAIAFASQFYESLGSGADVQTAFDLARHQIAIARSTGAGSMRDIDSPKQPPPSDEQLGPILLVRPGLRASELRFVDSARR